MQESWAGGAQAAAKQNLEHHFAKSLGKDLKDRKVKKEIQSLAELGSRTGIMDAKSIMEVKANQNIDVNNESKNERSGEDNSAQLWADSTSWMEEDAKRKAAKKGERRKRLGLMN